MAIGIGVMSLPMELVGAEEFCMQDMEIEEDDKQEEKQENEKDDTQNLKEYILAPGSSLDPLRGKGHTTNCHIGSYLSPVIEVAVKPPIRA